MLFKEVKGGSVVVRKNGVFRECALFLFGKEQHVFAKVGTGYVHLYDNKSTSQDKLRWEAITAPFATAKDSFGRMVAGEQLKGE